MRFDFDKRLGTMVPRKEESKIFTLMQRPSRSCYIYLLANDTFLHSVGNLRCKEKVWFDVRDMTISSSPEKTDSTPLRVYRMAKGGFPKYWTYA